MFYIPRQSDVDQYSQSFRRLIKRAVQRISNQQRKCSNGQQKFKKDDEQCLENKKYGFQIKKNSLLLRREYSEQNNNFNHIRKSIILPKLLKNQCLNNENESSHLRIIRQSDKQLKRLSSKKDMIEKLNSEAHNTQITELRIKKWNKCHSLKNRQKIMTRKIKSQCSEIFSKMRKNMPFQQQQQIKDEIKPWSYQITSNKFYYHP